MPGPSSREAVAIDMQIRRMTESVSTSVVIPSIMQTQKLLQLLNEYQAVMQGLALARTREANNSRLAGKISAQLNVVGASVAEMVGAIHQLDVQLAQWQALLAQQLAAGR